MFKVSNNNIKLMYWMFYVNSKDTTTTSTDLVMLSLLLILNTFSVFIVKLEQPN